jgi:hypothetical protein
VPDEKLRPGQRVRVCTDAEVVRLPNGQLGVLIDDEDGDHYGLFGIDVFEVHAVESGGSPDV